MASKKEQSTVQAVEITEFSISEITRVSRLSSKF